MFFKAVLSLCDIGNWPQGFALSRLYFGHIILLDKMGYTQGDMALDHKPIYYTEMKCISLGIGK